MSDIVHFLQIPPFEQVGQILHPRVGAIRCLYYVLCLSVTKLFLVLFKYFIVIIMKVEMLYLVLNIIAF